MERDAIFLENAVSKMQTGRPAKTSQAAWYNRVSKCKKNYNVDLSAVYTFFFFFFLNTGAGHIIRISSKS